MSTNLDSRFDYQEIYVLIKNESKYEMNHLSIYSHKFPVLKPNDSLGQSIYISDKNFDEIITFVVLGKSFAAYLPSLSEEKLEVRSIKIVVREISLDKGSFELSTSLN